MNENRNSEKISFSTMLDFQRVNRSLNCRSLSSVHIFIKNCFSLSGSTVSSTDAHLSTNEIDIDQNLFGDDHTQLLPARTEDIFAKYYFGGSQEIGKGRFGDVRSAIDRVTGEKVAIKRIPKWSTTQKRISNEVVLLRLASHPNVVQLKLFFSNQKHWFIVMELIRGIELYERLSIGGLLPIKQSVAILYQLSSALAHLHCMGIVHSDVKPENIIFIEVANANVQMKLIDFGSSFSLNGAVAESQQYTPIYSPPEVIMEKIVKDPSSDIWSFGVVAFILLQGSHPFDVRNRCSDIDLVQNIISGKPDFSGTWKDVQKPLIQEIKLMLNKNPRRRPKAKKTMMNIGKYL